MGLHADLKAGVREPRLSEDVGRGPSGRVQHAPPPDLREITGIVPNGAERLVQEDNKDR